MCPSFTFLVILTYSSTEKIFFYYKMIYLLPNIFPFTSPLLMPEIQCLKTHFCAYISISHSTFSVKAPLSSVQIQPQACSLPWSTLPVHSSNLSTRFVPCLVLFLYCTIYFSLCTYSITLLISGKGAPRFHIPKFPQHLRYSPPEKMWINNELLLNGFK